MIYYYIKYQISNRSSVMTAISVSIVTVVVWTVQYENNKIHSP